MSDDPYSWIEDIPEEDVTVAHYRALCEQIWNNEATKADKDFIDGVASECRDQLIEERTFPADLTDQDIFWAGWDIGQRLSFLHVDNDCHDEDIHRHMMHHMIRGARFSALVAMVAIAGALLLCPGGDTDAGGPS